MQATRLLPVLLEEVPRCWQEVPSARGKLSARLHSDETFEPASGQQRAPSGPCAVSSVNLC